MSYQSVDVAQLAEHWTVAPVVAGSRPVIHPIPYSQQDHVTFVFHVCQERGEFDASYKHNFII